MTAAFVALTFGLTACEKESKAEGASTTQKASSKATVPAAKATGKTAPAGTANQTQDAKPKAKAVKFADRPFKITYTSQPAAVGGQAQTAIKIEPLDGYKMNKDFPNSLTVDALETADIGKTSFGAEDCTLSEKELTYGVPFKAKSAGEIKMTGKTNFSVCNERTCKLYRGEKVAWTVTAK
jgi:hypothetical protein